jgi:hypothetical protein
MAWVMAMAIPVGMVTAMVMAMVMPRNQGQNYFPSRPSFFEKKNFDPLIFFFHSNFIFKWIYINKLFLLKSLYHVRI